MPSALDNGERNPFFCGALPFVRATKGSPDGGCFGFDLRRRDRGGEESVVSSVTSPRCCCRRAAERVVGAEYPSRNLDEVLPSDGVGDGEATLGAEGTAPGLRADDIWAVLTEKGGRATAAISPERGRLCKNQLLQPATQGMNESLASEDGMMGRCLSKREVKVKGRWLGVRLARAEGQGRDKAAHCRQIVHEPSK